MELNKRIIESIDDPFHHILTINKIQFEQTYHGEVKIFNYGFHDIKTQETMYGVAKKSQSQGNHWIMSDTLLTAKQIESKYNVLCHRLPLTISSASTSNDMIMIKSVFKDKEKRLKLINGTKWHNKKKFCKTNNKRRMEFKLTKEEFIHDLKASFEEKQEDIDLIPIVVINSKNKNVKYRIEYIIIIKLINKNNLNCPINIGISFKYDKNDKSFNVCGVSGTGLYIDKQYLLSQHQLISSCTNHSCKSLKNFTSYIDELSIGNPDYWKNKFQDMEKQFKKLKANYNKPI